MRVIVAVMLLIVVGALPALASKTSDFNAAYREYTALAEAGKFAEAVGPAEKAYELGIDLLGPEDEQVGMLATNLGMVLFQSERYKPAIKWTKKAIEIFEANYGKNDARLIDTWMNLATIHQEAIMPDEEQRALRKALKIAEENGEAYEVVQADIRMKLGIARHFSHKTDMGASQFKAAEELYAARLGPAHAKTGNAALWQGKAKFGLGKFRWAEPHFVRALEIFQDAPEIPHQFTQTTHAFLVQIYEKMGDDEKSTDHCIAAGRVQKRGPDDDYQPLYRTYPEYPYEKAARYGEGEVLVEFTVTAQGRTKDAKIVSSKGGKLFERSALEALEKWRYAPTIRDGDPVDTAGIQTLISFKIPN